VPSVIVAVMTHSAADSITCLTGVTEPGRRLPLDIGRLNRDVVLGNGVIFGSVNANRRHYEAAVAALAAADASWLKRLITRTVPLEDFREAFERREDDVKVVLDLQATG
jgi:threonine dehydrogenase-like Zn-dependent dehydrogenase